MQIKKLPSWYGGDESVYGCATSMQSYKNLWTKFGVPQVLHLLPGFTEYMLIPTKYPIANKARIFSITNTGRSLTAGSHVNDPAQQANWWGRRQSKSSAYEYITQGQAYGKHRLSQFTATKNRIVFQTGRVSCLAYHNDEMWNTLHFLAYPHGKHAHPNLICRDMWRSRTSYCQHSYVHNCRPNIYSSGKLLSIPYDTAIPEYTLEQLAKTEVVFREVVNLYVRIPWLLLNPDPLAERWARRKKPSKLTKVQLSRLWCLSTNGATYDPEFRFTMPGSVLYHPALFWFVNALGREAIMLASAYKGQQDPRTKVHADILRSLVDPEHVAEVVDTHDFKKALEIWHTIRPYILRQACEGTIVNQAWWTASPWNRAISSSVHWFENTVRNGGWISFGPDMVKNWKLSMGHTSVHNYNVIRSGDHANWARGWANFLLKDHSPVIPLEPLPKDLRQHRTEAKESFHRHLESVSWA